MRATATGDGERRRSDLPKRKTERFDYGEETLTNILRFTSGSGQTTLAPWPSVFPWKENHMTAAHEVWSVTLDASQADDIVMVATEEAISEAEQGDPRNVTDDCASIKQAIRSRRRQGGNQVEVEVVMTARQWNVVVAALDRATLRTLRNGEAEVADSFADARDAVLAQVAVRLPHAQSRQEVRAQHHFTVEEAHGYVLFQPSRRGRYSFGSINESMLDDYGTPHITTLGNGKAVVALMRTSEVNVEIQVLPEAPELDHAAWDSISEITQQWTGFPYPELVLAVPGQEGTVLWDLTTELWPHVTYRMRLNANTSGRAVEDHLLQMWPDHSAPPTVHKPTR